MGGDGVMDVIYSKLQKVVDKAESISATVFDALNVASKITYQHARGDAEMVGNANYSTGTGNVVGFYEKMPAYTVFNRFSGYVYASTGTSGLEWKIFVRPTATTFNPNTETADASGTLASSDVAHTGTSATTIVLDTPLYVKKGEHVFVLFRANVGVTVIQRWDADSGVAPLRHGFVFTTASGWAANLSFGGSTFKQAAIKLWYDIKASQSTASWYKKLALPPKMYAVVGKELNVYFDNLLSDSYTNYLIDVTCSQGTHQDERWTFIPAAAGGPYGLTIAVYDKFLNLVKQEQTLVYAVAADARTGVNATCLFIGDSTTAGGNYTGELLTLFGADAMDITLIGTQGTAPNLHEGVSGKTVDHFYSNVASPFVFSGSFDFSQYMTSHSFASVDYVFIHLGINDVVGFTTDAQVDALATANFTKLDAMITSMKAFNANVKVGLMVVIPPSQHQDAFGKNYFSGIVQWRYKRNIHRYNRLLIERYTGMESSNIYLVPTNTNIDTIYGMDSESVPANSRTTVNITRQKNGVHPIQAGYNQMADTIYYWLKGN